MRETWVWSLDWEDPLEKGILAWRIPFQYSCLENSMDCGQLPLEPSYHVVRKPKPHREVIASQMRCQQTAIINCQIGEWEASRWFQPLDFEPPQVIPCEAVTSFPADPCPLADLWAKQMIAVVLSHQLTLWGDLLHPSRYPRHTLLYCKKACTSKSQYRVNQPRGSAPKGHFYSAISTLLYISYICISLKKTSFILTSTSPQPDPRYTHDYSYATRPSGRCDEREVKLKTDGGLYKTHKLPTLPETNLEGASARGPEAQMLWVHRKSTSVANVSWTLSKCYLG